MQRNMPVQSAEKQQLNVLSCGGDIYNHPHPCEGSENLMQGGLERMEEAEDVAKCREMPAS